MRGPEEQPGRRDRRRAWLALWGYVPAFVLAFVVGEGLYSLLGYPRADGAAAPSWVVVVSGGPALLLFVTPGVVAALYARRADRAGDPEAIAPAVVGAVIGLGFVAINLLSYALQQL